jgi:endonuclease/exonuclease/phosphatase family metal-dependent hydrolase
MERRERGFIGKVVVFLLSALAVIGLLAMMLCALCPFVNPSRFVWLAYFGLAFWEILAFNVVVFLLLLLMWSRKVWIAVLALVLAVPGFKKSFSFGSKVEAAQSLKVMSYNVHFFNHFDGQTNREDYINQIVNTVREQSPDVLCIQEFVTYNYRLRYRGCIEDFAQRTGLPYVYHKSKGRATNVIFSKYPITKVADDTGFDKENSFGVMVSVDAGERGRFYLANVHLTSYMVTSDEIDVLVNPSEQRDVLDTIGLTVAHKLRIAYEKRGIEIGEMLQSIPKVDAPVIVCGDFNDTPLSYVYRQMQKAGFKDTFTKVGRGIKPTYAGRLPLLRIDYMWANDKVTPLSFTRCRRKASDHYPVILEFALQQ